MTSPKPTPPPTRPRLPTAAEADEMCGRAFLEAIKELNEEKRQKRETRLEPQSDYELDDVATKVQFATLDRLIKKREDEAKRQKGETR